MGTDGIKQTHSAGVASPPQKPEKTAGRGPEAVIPFESILSGTTTSDPVARGMTLFIAPQPDLVGDVLHHYCSPGAVGSIDRFAAKGPSQSLASAAVSLDQLRSDCQLLTGRREALQSQMEAIEAELAAVTPGTEDLP
ncbi:MAG: hypothetical protein HYV02_02410 [Deltaproteobacteria bacterium]|nr:hypothetical protein [Deltaproteobacteria bacterium]